MGRLRNENYAFLVKAAGLMTIALFCCSEKFIKCSPWLFTVLLEVAAGCLNSKPVDVITNYLALTQYFD